MDGWMMEGGVNGWIDGGRDEWMDDGWMEMDGRTGQESGF